MPFGILMTSQHRRARASFPVVLKFLCTTAGLKEPNGMKYVEAFALPFKAMFYKGFNQLAECFSDRSDQ